MKNNPILKRLYHAGMLCILLCVNSGLHAQSLIKGMEYFVDTDPGIGKAKFAPVQQGMDVTTTLDIPVTNLSAGLHTAGVRMYNGQRWSATYTKCFIIPFSEAELVLSRAEYFWDTDPGVGLATAFDNAPSGSDVTMDFQLSGSELAEGLHTLGIRVQANGVWSSTYVKQVLVVKPWQEKPIVAVEYFWDEDPGIGKAAALTNLSAGTEVIADVTIATDKLSAGLHCLGIRCHNGERWSSTYTKQVYVAGEKHLVDALEYFWDEDPGYGKGTLVACTPAEVVEFDLGEVTMPDASMGTHRLYLRARSGGTWSQTSIKDYCINANPDFSFPNDTVCVNERIIVSNLTTEATDATTYAWDMNGDGKVDATDADDFVYTYTKSGEFTASLTVKTVGDCETTCYKKIVVLSTDNPSVNLRVNNTSSTRLTICKGDAVTFSALSYNSGDAPVYEWLLNDAVIASGSKDTLKLDSLKNNDMVKVRVISSNPCCAVEDAVSGSVKMTVNALPELTLAHYFPVYTTEDSFILDGGMPEGGTYYVDGKATSLFNPSKYETGMHQVTYRFTNSSGCTSEITRSFELKAPGDNSLLPGDVNKDEKVDVMDIICAVDIIYGRTYPSYNLTTADIDKNKKVDVSDIVGIVSIILDKYSSSQTLMKQAKAATTVNMHAIDAYGESGTAIPLEFHIEGNQWISGMQFDVTLPDGIALSSGNPDILVGYAPGRETNTYRILSYSTALTKLANSVSLSLEIPESMLTGDYPVMIDEVVLSDNSMRNVAGGIKNGILHIGSPTGVGSNETDMYVRSERQGIRVFNAESAVCVISDTTGNLLVKEELRESSQYIPLQVVSGIYIVELQKGEQRMKVKFVIK